MIVIATHNQHKYAEFVELLKQWNPSITSLKQLGVTFDVEETGTTFEENARLKAMTMAEHLQADVIADDSGLEIEALANFPGIQSARFMGHNTDYRIKNQKILDMMKGQSNRRAYFVCSIAFARLHQPIVSCTYRLEGVIAHEPRGMNGFGYDPIFLIQAKNKTFAELTALEKNTISHRANAIKMLLKMLEEGQK